MPSDLVRLKYKRQRVVFAGKTKNTPLRAGSRKQLQETAFKMQKETKQQMKCCLCAGAIATTICIVPQLFGLLSLELSLIFGC